MYILNSSSDKYQNDTEALYPQYVTQIAITNSGLNLWNYVP